MFFYSIIAFFLVQASFAETDRDYSVFSYEDRDKPFQLRFLENDNDFDTKRLMNYLSKYGKNNERYKDGFTNVEDDFDGVAEKRGKNNNFLRFGRNDQGFLRFGRNQIRAARDKENFVRFGRALANSDKAQERIKRENIPSKKPVPNDIFIRYGRKPSFL